MLLYIFVVKKCFLFYVIVNKIKYGMENCIKFPVLKRKLFESKLFVLLNRFKLEIKIVPLKFNKLYMMSYL